MSDQNRVISLNKEVLRQVLKDGKTYPTLAKQMAEVILEEMVNDGLPDRVEIIEFGQISDFNDPDVRKTAKSFADQTGLPIYADGEGREVKINTTTAWGDTMVRVSELVRWTFGE